MTWLLVAWLTRFKVSFLKDILKRSFLPLYVHSNGEILRDFKIVMFIKARISYIMEEAIDLNEDVAIVSTFNSLNFSLPCDIFFIIL